MSGNYLTYREEQIKNGQQFQDFCADVLYAQGYPITTYSSQLYQYQVGESRGGWEFKYDMKYAQTRNIYIEIAEKAQPRAGDYYPSGIYAKSNTVFYVIGNYECFFVFDKKILLAIQKHKRIIENGTKTSKGFLLLPEEPEEYCILQLQPRLSIVMKASLEQYKKRTHELYRKLKSNASNFTPRLPFDDDDNDNKN